MDKFRVMSKQWAKDEGYSLDKRKRRNQHREAARQLSKQGGSIAASVVPWHLFQARYIGR